MPCAMSPEVVTVVTVLPILPSVTVPPSTPVPPDPPSVIPSDRRELALNCAEPAMPPPPPTLCASRPVAA